MAVTGKEFVTISQLKTTINSINTSSSSIDAYPVGSIYMSVNSTSQQRCLVGRGSGFKTDF